MVAWYRSQTPITANTAALLEADLNEEVAQLRADNLEMIEHETAALARLKDQRKKLLHVYYDDKITEELFAEEQARLDKEARQAQIRLNQAEIDISNLTTTITQAVELLRLWPEVMPTASIRLQRQFLKAFYETIWVTIGCDLMFWPHLSGL